MKHARHAVVSKRVLETTSYCRKETRFPFHLRTSISHRIARTGTASSSSIHDTWSSHSSAIQWHDTHPATVPWNHASWSYKLCLHHIPLLANGPPPCTFLLVVPSLENPLIRGCNPPASARSNSRPNSNYVAFWRDNALPFVISNYLVLHRIQSQIESDRF